MFQHLGAAKEKNGELDEDMLIMISAAWAKWR